MICRRRNPRAVPTNTAPVSHANPAVPNALMGGAPTHARAAPYPTIEMGCIVRLISEPDRTARASATGVTGPGVAVQTGSAPVTNPAKPTPAQIEAADGRLPGARRARKRCGDQHADGDHFENGAGKDGSAEAAAHPARVAVDARAKSPHRTSAIPQAAATTDTSRLSHSKICTPTPGPSHRSRKGPQTTLSPAPTATWTAAPASTRAVHPIQATEDRVKGNPSRHWSGIA
jgi:hypothetical protein